MAKKNDPELTDPLVTKIHEYHNEAYGFIVKALSVDETRTDPEKALELYKEGLKGIEKALAINIDYGKGEKFERARNLQKKLLSNLVQTKDRVSVLESLVSLRNLEPEKAPAPHRKNVSSHAPPRRKFSSGPTPTVAPAAVANGRSYVPAAVPTKSKLEPKMNLAARNRINSAQRGGSGQTGGSGVNSDRNAKMAKQDVVQKISALKGVETRLANMICDEILDANPSVTSNDIVGQDTAKEALREMVILPAVRPELFTGLRAPARGLLLFGPPGNGKTMLAKAVATEAKARFFNISASSLTSKWFGEGEKLVRALFAVANAVQPSIIFIDEVDSLLSTRREGEMDAMKRLKTEFLVQLDGVASNSENRVVLMGATNLPHELDHAALRRFTKRVYVGMPDLDTRVKLLQMLLAKHEKEANHQMTRNSQVNIGPSELRKLAAATEGYSASDLTNLARDAALEAIRECDEDEIRHIPRENLRPINYRDFERAMKRIRSSVPKESLAVFENWNKQFGDIS